MSNTSESMKWEVLFSFAKEIESMLIENDLISVRFSISDDDFILINTDRSKWTMKKSHVLEMIKHVVSPLDSESAVEKFSDKCGIPFAVMHLVDLNFIYNHSERLSFRERDLYLNELDMMVALNFNSKLMTKH